MILLLVFALIYALHSKTKILPLKSRNNIIVCFIFAMITIVLFNLYVEYSVGWKYGVPYDDDSSWIFRAAEAMSEGSKWDVLYKLVSRDWDLTNRVLSLSNLGQYIYATIIRFCLYSPVMFDLHINIYLVYLAQLLLLSIGVINVIIELSVYGRRYFNKIPAKSSLFYIIMFYPIVVFNAGKMMREALNIFCLLEVFYYFLVYVNSGKISKAFMLFSLLTLIIRPNSIVLILPLCLYMYLGVKIALISNTVIFVILMVGTLIVNRIMAIVGWNYSFGEVNLIEMLHLFLFPNIINQFKDFITIFSSPSWQTVLYFFQSLWNIPYIILMITGILNNKNKSLTILFITIIINALAIYSLIYDIDSFTPRYKLIYFIPQLYFVYTGMCYMKNKIRLR